MNFFSKDQNVWIAHSACFPFIIQQIMWPNFWVQVHHGGRMYSIFALARDNPKLFWFGIPFLFLGINVFYYLLEKSMFGFLTAVICLTWLMANLFCLPVALN